MKDFAKCALRGVPCSVVCLGFCIGGGRADRSDSPRSARPTWHSLRTGRRRGVMLHVVHVLSGFHTPLCRGCRHIYIYMTTWYHHACRYPNCLYSKFRKTHPRRAQQQFLDRGHSKCSKSRDRRDHMPHLRRRTHSSMPHLHFAFLSDPPRTPQTGEVSSALYFMDSKIQKLTFKHEDAPSASVLPARPLAWQPLRGR